MVRMLSGTAHRGSDLERSHNRKVMVEGVCEVDGPASFGFLPFSLFLLSAQCAIICLYLSPSLSLWFNGCLGIVWNRKTSVMEKLEENDF